MIFTDVSHSSFSLWMDPHAIQYDPLWSSDRSSDDREAHQDVLSECDVCSSCSLGQVTCQAGSVSAKFTPSKMGGHRGIYDSVILPNTQNHTNRVPSEIFRLSAGLSLEFVVARSLPIR